MFKIRPVSTGVKFEPVKELEVEKYLVELNWKDYNGRFICRGVIPLILEIIKKEFI